MQSPMRIFQSLTHTRSRAPLAQQTAPENDGRQHADGHRIPHDAQNGFLRVMWDQLYAELLEVAFGKGSHHFWLEDSRQRYCQDWLTLPVSRQYLLARCLLELVEAMLTQEVLLRQWGALMGQQPAYRCWCSEWSTSQLPVPQDVSTLLTQRSQLFTHALEDHVHLAEGRAHHLPHVWAAYRERLLRNEP